jgi:hypothetical protein
VARTTLRPLCFVTDDLSQSRLGDFGWGVRDVSFGRFFDYEMRSPHCLRRAAAARARRFGELEPSAEATVTSALCPGPELLSLLRPFG